MSVKEKVKTDRETKKEIDPFRTVDFSNNFRRLYRINEYINSYMVMEDTILIGSSIGHVFLFSKNEGYKSDTCFDEVPVVGFALYNEEVALVIQPEKILKMDLVNSKVIGAVKTFGERQIVSATYNPTDLKQFCCVLRNQKTKEYSLKVDNQLDRTFSDKVIPNSSGEKWNTLNKLKWFGKTILMILSTRGAEGKYTNITIVYFDLSKQKFSNIQFGKLEIDAQALCSVTQVNSETVIITWGFIKGEFQASPSFAYDGEKTFEAPTTFFLPHNVTDIYSTGMVNDKMIGYVYCENNVDPKYGLRYLVSNDERDKVPTYPSIKKDDISSTLFELYGDRVDKIRTNESGDKIVSEDEDIENEYNEKSDCIWLLTKKTFIKITLLNDNDIIDGWTKDKQYNLILDRVAKIHMEVDVTGFWENFILGFKNKLVQVENSEDGYQIMETYLDNGMMSVGDFAELCLKYNTTKKEFKDKNSKESKEQKKRYVKDLDNMNTIINFFTGYTLYEVSKIYTRYNELCEAFKNFKKNKDNVISYQQAFNVLNNSIVKETIQVVKGVSDFSAVSKDDTMSLLITEIDKYRTLLLFPKMPNFIQEQIAMIYMKIKTKEETQKRVFEVFNLRYKLENMLLKEAQDFVFKLKSPELLEIFLTRLQEIYDERMQSVVDKDQLVQETQNVFTSDGYDITNLVKRVKNKAGFETPLVVEIINSSTTTNPKSNLKYKLYQMLFKLLREKNESLSVFDDTVRPKYNETDTYERFLLDAANSDRNTPLDATNSDKNKKVVVDHINNILSQFTSYEQFMKTTNKTAKKETNQKDEKTDTLSIGDESKREAYDTIASVMDVVNSLSFEFSKNLVDQKNFPRCPWAVTLLYSLSAYKDRLVDTLPENNDLKTYAQPICEGLRVAELKSKALSRVMEMALNEQYLKVNSKLRKYKKGVVLDFTETCTNKAGDIGDDFYVFKCGHYVCSECMSLKSEDQIECIMCKLKNANKKDKSTAKQTAALKEKEFKDQAEKTELTV
ncbi:hypothetical protein EIN_468320 [Entamoeba invadens IP1]|uniref:RING-type domain-containing protein n=1 Tax=Entamoeba invadens IP1 TaxID=370355 RepID=A0A0A1TWI3_ENTIV|nr:hypothetical protein EIN_468320 [Entamoeba invadens IP1]ELP83698.1 hypothetical protein EIN_468320 [Entamoeba invadens IP1]|eukprot:XP_004183044.1 hypothetical protein EIN_468320 [Entamoeba invadens IP1]